MIKSNNLVRQGTLAGPRLCGISAGKVNSIERSCITNIKMRTFVDDINFLVQIWIKRKKAVNDLREMKKYKGFTFNVGISKYSNTYSE